MMKKTNTIKIKNSHKEFQNKKLNCKYITAEALLYL